VSNKVHTESQWHGKEIHMRQTIRNNEASFFPLFYKIVCCSAGVILATHDVMFPMSVSARALALVGGLQNSHA